MDNNPWMPLLRPQKPCNASEPPETSQGHPLVKNFLDGLWELHKEKSGGYGTGEDPFANFTAVSNVSGRPRFLYPLDRIVEKITRVYSLAAQNRWDEIEEELRDGASCFACSAVMFQEDQKYKRDPDADGYR